MSESSNPRDMQAHWNDAFSAKPGRFGSAPSDAAQLAVRAFAAIENPAPQLLELGAGEGRDTVYFAERGFKVTALDFSQVALDALKAKVAHLGISERVELKQHNVRSPLPYPDGSFDACYSHMLYCMDFTFDELVYLSEQVRRVLKHGGIHVYTVRTTADPDFGVGQHLGEQRYEDEGFIVHFFNRDMIARLAAGFRILDIVEFDEGSLPRRLFAVTLERC